MAWKLATVVAMTDAIVRPPQPPLGCPNPNPAREARDARAGTQRSPRNDTYHSLAQPVREPRPARAPALGLRSFFSTFAWLAPKAEHTGSRVRSRDAWGPGA